MASTCPLWNKAKISKPQALPLCIGDVQSCIQPPEVNWKELRKHEYQNSWKEELFIFSELMGNKAKLIIQGSKISCLSGDLVFPW